MNRKQFCLVFVMGVVAGLMGGIMATHFISAPASAQKAVEHERILLAEQFGLVDKDSNIYAKIFLTPEDRPALMLYDRLSQQETVLELSEDWMSVINLLRWFKQETD